MAERGIAVKLVGSISPINGNAPSFTVASIDARDSGDERLPGDCGVERDGRRYEWTEEYDFATTYKTRIRSLRSSVRDDLIAGFEADPDAHDKASQSYIRDYGAGMGARELSMFWKPYACSLRNDGADAFRACVCGAER